MRININTGPTTDKFIAATSTAAVLYGSFRLLRLKGTQMAWRDLALGAQDMCKYYASLVAQNGIELTEFDIMAINEMAARFGQVAFPEGKS